MNRATWGTVNAVILTGLIIGALTVWMPAKIGAQPRPVPSPPAMKWEPITPGMAALVYPYTSGREDWSGCETRGVSPLHVRCPDGYTLEIR